MLPTSFLRVFPRLGVGLLALAGGMIAVSRPSARPIATQHGTKEVADRVSIQDTGRSAFPFESAPDDVVIPETNGTRFFQRDADGRAFHMAPRGGKLSESTYQDRRSLLFVPKGFRPDAPAAIVLFFHGNLATLSRDVARRQRVPAQVQASHANVLLAAPQLATDALDSSAGNFWRPGFLDEYLAAAAQALAAMPGNGLSAERIAGLPVIIVAYSGGYLPTAFSLQYSGGQAKRRIAGVILLDALFGEQDKFAAWIDNTKGRSFFVSLFSKGSADLNANLERDIGGEALHSMPERIGPGDIVFQSAPTAVHTDFVTRAGTTDPLARVLAKVDLSRLAGMSPQSR